MTKPEAGVKSTYSCKMRCYFSRSRLPKRGSKLLHSESIVASRSEENRAGDGPEAGIFVCIVRNDLNGE